MRSTAIAVLSIFAVACSADLNDRPAAPEQVSEAELTWFRDIEPIVQERCQSCHSTGGIAPFKLMSYVETKGFGEEIARAVGTKLMPPWPPSRHGVALRYDRSLKNAEIDLVQRWVRGGMQEGDPADHRERHPLLPRIRADAELRMKVPYVPDTGTSGDDYRCFVLDGPVSAEPFITGYEIKPGLRTMAHHAVLYEVVDVEGAFAELQGLDDASPEPGFRCVGGPQLRPRAGKDPLSVIGSWKPGEGAVPLPEGSGLALQPHARFVLEVHYAGRGGSGGGDTTSATLQLSHGVRPALALLVLEKEIRIPAGASSSTVVKEEIVGREVPPSRIYSVFPHMHQFGSAVRFTVEHDGKEQVLVDIPRWSFDWQGAYQLEQPVPVSSGDRLRLSCTYDNSPEKQRMVNGVRQAPREVVWGSGAQDEMCQAYLYLVPLRPMLR